jgi:hypothetical protein
MKRKNRTGTGKSIEHLSWEETAGFKKMLRDRPSLIREIFEDLEHSGLIYDTGQRRNGQIVYAATRSSDAKKHT